MFAAISVPVENTKTLQAVRMRRFWLASSVYLICIPLLGLSPLCLEALTLLTPLKPR